MGRIVIKPRRQVKHALRRTTHIVEDTQLKIWCLVVLRATQNDSHRQIAGTSSGSTSRWIRFK